ncbi:MAG: hypothetical protein WDO24_09035 [Pseudomonadota bacterium]
MTRLGWRALMPQILYPALVFVLVIGGWEAGARTGLFPAYVLPAPSAVLVRGLGTVNLLLWHCWVTSGEILVGFLLALVIGVLLAAAIVFSRPVEQALYPWAGGRAGRAQGRDRPAAGGLVGHRVHAQDPDLVPARLLPGS